MYGLHSSYFQVFQIIPIVIGGVVTVPRPPITIDIIITFVPQFFLNSRARSRYLSFFSLYFNFTLLSAGTAKCTILQILFLFIITRSGCLAEIRWSICISKSLRSLASHSPGQMLGCAYSVCFYSQIQISYTFPSRLPCPTSRV